MCIYFLVRFITMLWAIFPWRAAGGELFLGSGCSFAFFSCCKFLAGLVHLIGWKSTKITLNSVKSFFFDSAVLWNLLQNLSSWHHVFSKAVDRCSLMDLTVPVEQVPAPSSGQQSLHSACRATYESILWPVYGKISWTRRFLSSAVFLGWLG